MRFPFALILLAPLALAKPPESKGFLRADTLREKIAERHAELKAAEEFAKKPREEKILLSFLRGDKRYDKKALDGKFVAETIVSWDDANRDEPTEAAKRVFEKMPEAFAKRYRLGIEVDKRGRYDASMVLWKGLDSKYLPLRKACILTLKEIYGTMNAFLYEPEMDKKERRKPLSDWKSFIKKQK